jgi:hypothetical protein
MLKVFSIVASGSLAMAFCAVTLAAPEPQSDRPGIVTQPRVKIDNRAPSEAIPVYIREWSAETAVRTQIVGTPTMTVSPESVVQARLVRQPWAYRTLRVPFGQDMAIALAVAGDDGWEATGVQTPDASGTTLLLKRPIDRR